MSDPATLLTFWLKTVGPKGWYEVNPKIDAQITEDFGALWQAEGMNGAGFNPLLSA